MKRYFWIMLAAMLPMAACNNSSEADEEDEAYDSQKIVLSADYKAPMKTLGDSLGHYWGMSQGMFFKHYVDNLPEAEKAKFDDAQAFLSGLRAVLEADTSSQAYFNGVQAGVQILQTIYQMHEGGIDINIKELYASLAKNIGKKNVTPQALDSVSMIANELFQKAQTKMVEMQNRKNQSEVLKNKEAGQKFLDKLHSDKSVVFNPSGLAYKIKKQGTGAVAAPNDNVKVKYAGKLIDGTEFDSSHGDFAEFAVQNVIPGFGEALMALPSGTKATLYIPADLGYGDRAIGNIPAGSLLIFDIEIQ